LIFGCSEKLEVIKKNKSTRNSTSTMGVRFMIGILVLVVRFSRNRIVL
jgi:hypothetical protein